MTTRSSCLILLGFSLLFTAGAQAQDADKGPLSWSADARLGYFGSRRDDRDGSTSDLNELRARLRLAADARLASALSARVRLAGRFGTEQDDLDFYIPDHAPSIDGLLLGQISFDEIYLNYRPADRWNVRLGRMQTKFELMGVAPKGLDRNDSPNVDITWTDGARLTYSMPSGWNADLILQHNAEEGPTNVLRPPLDFAESPVTFFAAMGSTKRKGAFVQRSVELTYIPQALRVDGAGRLEDYIGVVGRAAMAWPLSAGARRFLLGGEVGYAPNAPTHASLGTGAAADGEAGGLAFQVTASLFDVAPGHHVGLVYGRTEPGWLIAPDFRNNNHLLEGRYQWRITAAYSMEGRLRWRRDLHQLTNASEFRDDRDAYLRLSLKF